MRRTIWLLAALIACPDDSSETVAVTENTPEVTPEAPQEVATFDDRLSEAHTAVLSGRPEAVATVQALLADRPDNDALWRLLGYAGLGGGQAELLAALDGAEPVGGRAGRHHLLRAELALSLGRNDEAMKASRAALADEPDAAAALAAAAARAGAALPPEDPQGTDPAEALMRYAAGDKRTAAKYADAASKVAGWRAALLRAEVKSALGDYEGAAAELALAASSDDPRAQVQSGLQRTHMAMLGQLPAKDADSEAPKAVNLVLAALEAAVADGDGPTTAKWLDRATGLAMASNVADKAVAIATTVVEAAGEGAVGPRLALARSALAAGQPAIAFEAASAARAAAGDAEKAEAAWLEGWAALSLGRFAAADDAIGALSGARAQALRALTRGYQGAPSVVVGELPTSGLSDRDAAYVWLEAGRLGGPSGVRALQNAADAAKAAGLPSVAMEARLELERVTRVSDPATAAKVRKQLLASAGPDAAGALLRDELVARDQLAGGTAVFGEAGPADWRAVEGRTVLAGGAGGVAAWAAGRAAAVTGDPQAAIRFAEAVAVLPLHRRGILSTGTVLWGADGLPFEADASALVLSGVDESSLAAALNVHEAAHRLDAYRADFAQGRALLAGLDDTNREALLAAVARARAQVREALAGGGVLPTDSAAALAAAELAAGKDNVFGKMLPTPPPPVAELRSAMGGAAILSYIAGPEKVYGAALTPEGGGLKVLGSSAQLARDAGAHRAALEASALVEGKANHRAGNRLRAMLVDPFTGELRGLGRYQVIAPVALMNFTITTFPEQGSGLRWLADIRTVCMLPTLADIRLARGGSTAEAVEYKPDFLGLGAPVAVVAAATAEGAAAGGGEAGTPTEAPATSSGGVSDEELLRRHRAKRSLPADLVASSRSFGDEFRDLRVGERATEAAWEEVGATARYIQISTVEPSADGGFVLADGELTLAEIRATPMKAELVVITADAPGPMQLQRSRAFLDAGAGAVLVMAWKVDEVLQERFFDGYFAALNRDRPPARALIDARGSLMRDSLLGVDLDDPGIWGSALLFSSP